MGNWTDATSIMPETLERFWEAVITRIMELNVCRSVASLEKDNESPRVINHQVKVKHASQRTFLAAYK